MPSMQKTLKTILGGVAVVVGLVAIPLPALAQSIQIYYSPNCAGAYRTYAGVRDELWINDTFNAGPAAGKGSKIRMNAASVRMQPRTAVQIKGITRGHPANIDTAGCDSNTSTTASLCKNLTELKHGGFPENHYATLRNRNTSFVVRSTTTHNCVQRTWPASLAGELVKK